MCSAFLLTAVRDQGPPPPGSPARRPRSSGSRPRSMHMAVRPHPLVSPAKRKPSNLNVDTEAVAGETATAWYVAALCQLDAASGCCKQASGCCKQASMSTDRGHRERPCLRLPLRFLAGHNSTTLADCDAKAQTRQHRAPKPKMDPTRPRCPRGGGSWTSKASC